MSISQVLVWLLLAAEIIVAVPVLYLAVVAIAAMAVERHSRRHSVPGNLAAEASGAPLPRFAVLIPAHNEELLLGKTLKSLAELAYPHDRYLVCVVADNCTDHTADVARTEPDVRVYERFDEQHRSKGYALNWLLDRLEADEIICDAYVVVDADSIVEPRFLTALARELARGAQALQTRYSVLNVEDSASTALRALALTLICHVRCLGRNALGGSATVTNGVCLSRALLRRHPWQSYGLTEDYAYYLTLVQDGVSVRYVPDAVLLSPMPTTFQQMRSQDVRWEARQLDSELGEPLLRKAWRLFWAGVRHREYVRVDAAIELLIPPLSALVAACGVLVCVALLVGGIWERLLAGGLICALGCYIGAALYVLRPSPRMYRALLSVPRFILWKLWVYLVLRRKEQYTHEWVRTSRGEEAAA